MCNCELIEYINQKIKQKELDIEIEKMRHSESKLIEFSKKDVEQLKRYTSFLKPCESDCAYKQSKEEEKIKEHMLQNIEARLILLEELMQNLKKNEIDFFKTTEEK